MTLPTDLQSFLALVIGQPLLLGLLVAAGLQSLFTWWEGRTGQPIRAPDKTLISAIAPPLVAGGGWTLAAALGWTPWSWPDAAQAVYNGVLATVGGQIAYGAIKKVIAPPPQTITNTTNIGSVSAARDANLDSVLAPPPDAPPYTPDPTKRKGGF